MGEASQAVALHGDDEVAQQMRLDLVVHLVCIVFNSVQGVDELPRP